MTERGQILPLAVGWLLLIILGAVLFVYLTTVDEAGATAQRSADLAALAAARELGGNPSATPEELRAVAEEVARANGGRVTAFRLLQRGAIADAVEVTAVATAEGSVPAAGERHDTVPATARAGVTWSATLRGREFRPIDLHGATGRSAIVQAALAQVGWPYVWGGESREEGGFDCSGLVDFAYAAAGSPLPGRPTAASLWSMGQPIPAAALEAGDLVFLGAPSGAPYHVGLYAGDGMVVVAPHTGARVRLEPVSAGGWDGFARLAEAGMPDGVPMDSVTQAARSAGVPGHVLLAELEMDLRSDPDVAAAELASSMRRQPTLERALAEQLGDASLAALVLHQASGPGLGDGFRAEVRLLPRDVGRSAVAGGAAAVRMPRTGPPRGTTGGASGGGIAAAALHGAETAAAQLGKHGSGVAVQGLAGLQHLARFGLTGIAVFGPDRYRDLAGLAGSVWDAAYGVGETVAALGTAGLALDGWSLAAARFNLVGSLLSGISFGIAAAGAGTRRTRVGYGMLSAGSILSAAGMTTAGAGIVPLLAGGAVAVPPLGLALLATGAVVCVGGYIVLHPEWCRTVLRLGGGALDLAWKVESAPFRVAAGAARSAASLVRGGAGAVSDAAGSVADAAGGVADKAGSVLDDLL